MIVKIRRKPGRNDIMNDQRRKRLRKILDLFDDVLAEEQDAFDNLPENLQLSERGEDTSEKLDVLEEIKRNLEEIVENH